jgi:hypothetical protein
MNAGSFGPRRVCIQARSQVLDRGYANFRFTEFYEVRLRACADRDTMAPRKKRTRDALSVTVRGACPRTCPPLASAHACHRTSRKNLFDLSRCHLPHDPNVRARGGYATQVRTVPD